MGFAMSKPPVAKLIIVPYGADETIYLVVDRIGRRDGIDRETEVERPDIETILTELMSGRFNDPIRVIAFNTLEHWAKDISAEIAAEIRVRCDIEGEEIPEYIRDFAASFAEPPRSRVTPGSRNEADRNRSIAAV
jgi:hypothetical protein